MSFKEYFHTMRASLFLFILFNFFCYTNVKAQTPFVVNFGIKGGYQHSVTDAVDSYGEETGFISDEFYAGFWMEKSLNKNFRFSTELIYSSLLGEFDYLEIPILFDYLITKRLRFFAGPKLEINLDNYTETEGYLLSFILCS